VNRKLKGDGTRAGTSAGSCVRVSGFLDITGSSSSSSQTSLVEVVGFERLRCFCVSTELASRPRPRHSLNGCAACASLDPNLDADRALAEIDSGGCVWVSSQNPINSISRKSSRRS
jgi:hypothetical protein